MGCGESKHALATENTISKSKRSNSKKDIDVLKVSADGNVKEEVEKVDQILEKKQQQHDHNDDDQKPMLEEKNVKERHDDNDQQAKGEIEVENVKEDGEEKKEVKQEISIKATEEETKMAGPDQVKMDSKEVVEEKESTKEDIKIEAKPAEEYLKDHKEINETEEKKPVQSAEAKDSANN